MEELLEVKKQNTKLFKCHSQSLEQVDENGKSESILCYSLYCVIVFNYAFVKIIEKKFYGRRNAVEVKKFLFFKTKYDLDLLDDIIKSNIWMIDEIEEFEEHYESDSGIIFRLSDFLRLSTVSTDKCMSIGVSKESGKYIFQDNQTIRIQEKIGFSQFS